MKHESIVIAGAGHAGVVAAFRLRALGFQGSVTVVGDEPELPYHRPPLSKTALSQADGVQPQPLRQAALYEREHIQLLSGCRVQAIHRSAQVVELSDGRELDYGALILATGSRPRTLTQAEAADNVHTLRTLADARRIRAAVEDSQHLLVVGGGYIGLEVAASARQMGIHVTLVEQHSRILGRVASAQTAARFRTLHQDEGVVLKEGVGIAALTAESGRITHAVLTDGTELPVDNIIAGIGVLPNVEVAQAAGLEADNGIRVDATCRTSDPVIYAIGDCASFLYRGMPVRLESVQNATDMADAAARA
ncbi:MAG TPA: NAD(P)/FAD-dependent oxidoreductase, partial [Burkholderiaceae bacterium]|nr:NAD(P)/FAD-dependent oxidoreductase [Burkholderiaceae bacterium]